MTVKDIPIGETMSFGENRAVNASGMSWVKVSEENDFLLNETCLSFLSVDEREPKNPIQVAQTHGDNFFPRSNVFQYLNARGGGWFTPAHEFDEAPGYKDADGFLSYFAPWELGAIAKHTIACEVPRGQKRALGNMVELTCSVSLPSVDELKYSGDGDDMRFKFFRDVPRANIATVTRSVRGTSSMVKITSDGRAIGHSPCNKHIMTPRIRIKDFYPVGILNEHRLKYCLLSLDGASSIVDYEEFLSILSAN